MPLVDASTAVMADPVVPEDKRFCSASAAPKSVGPRVTSPGVSERASAPSVGEDLLVRPQAQEGGDLVAGQYEVAGCLAHGGLGWIYLAKDRNVSDRWVVLKACSTPATFDALAAAIAEQRFLAQVEHPHIVEIYNFVTFDGAGYIVMRYVGGTSLKAVLKQRMRKTGSYDPLPVDQAQLCSRDPPRLQYLHDLGLACHRFSPTTSSRWATTSSSSISVGCGGSTTRTRRSSAPSVIRRLVAGGVRRVGHLHDWANARCADLRVRGYQTTYVDSLPPTDRVPAFARHGCSIGWCSSPRAAATSVRIG